MSAKTSESMAENMADRIPEYVANRNPARMPDKVFGNIYIYVAKEWQIEIQVKRQNAREIEYQL